MDAIKFTFLRGTHDDTNPLSLIRGNWVVLHDIIDRLERWYRDHVDTESVAFNAVAMLVYARTGVAPFWMTEGILDAVLMQEYAQTCGLIPYKFPAPTGININMMPIKMFQPETLPDFCKKYEELIHKCARQVERHYDRVAYLTIHESTVQAGSSQRRPGLHIERPGQVVDGGRIVKKGDNGFHELAWGMGDFRYDKPVDGIFMASNVSDSCRVWPVKIIDPHEVSDAHGGIEHMREHIGEGRNLKAGELCWFTDCTPHESLPLENTTHRTFFRLVVGRISVWYAKHNTPNPLGVLPDAPVSDADKFSLQEPLRRASPVQHLRLSLVQLSFRGTLIENLPPI